ncbi:hypothetical protein TorRG33x02_350060, partial [Trema orientale]
MATTLQTCKVGGVDIPCFCYCSYLSIANNGWMCLVKVKKASKPVAFCTMPALP